MKGLEGPDHVSNRMWRFWKAAYRVIDFYNILSWTNGVHICKEISIYLCSDKGISCSTRVKDCRLTCKGFFAQKYLCRSVKIMITNICHFQLQWNVQLCLERQIYETGKGIDNYPARQINSREYYCKGKSVTQCSSSWFILKATIVNYFYHDQYAKALLLLSYKISDNSHDSYSLK